MWLHYIWYRIKIRYQIKTVPTPTVAWTRARLLQRGGGGLKLFLTMGEPLHCNHTLCALRATFNPNFPPKSRKHTPSKCLQNEATLASLARTRSRTTFPSHNRCHERMSLGSVMPLRIPNKTNATKDKGESFPPSNLGNTTIQVRTHTMHTMHPCAALCHMDDIHCKLVGMIFKPANCIRRRMQINRG